MVHEKIPGVRNLLTNLFDGTKDPSKDRYLCSICNSRCFTAINYDQHMKGRKHALNVLEATERASNRKNGLRDKSSGAVTTGANKGKENSEFDAHVQSYKRWRTQESNKGPPAKKQKLKKLKKSKDHNHNKIPEVVEIDPKTAQSSMMAMMMSGAMQVGGNVQDPIIQQFVRIMTLFSSFSELKGRVTALDRQRHFSFDEESSPIDFQSMLKEIDLSLTLQKASQQYGMSSLNSSLNLSNSGNFSNSNASEMSMPVPNIEKEEESGVRLWYDNERKEWKWIATDETTDANEKSKDDEDTPTIQLLRSKIASLKELLDSLKSNSISDEKVRSKLEILRADNEQPAKDWNKDFESEQSIKTLVELRQQKKDLIEDVEMQLADSDIEIVAEYKPTRGPGIFAQSRRFSGEESPPPPSQIEIRPVIEKEPLLRLSEAERDQSYQRFLILVPEAVRIFDTIPPYVLMNLGVRSDAVRATLADFASGSLHPDQVDFMPLSEIERKFIKFLVRQVNFQQYPDIETAIFEFLAIEGLDPQSIMALPHIPVARQGSVMINDIESVKRSLIDHMSSFQ